MVTDAPHTEPPERVETPERVDLWVDLAGVGSRALAQLVDTFIIMVALAAVALALALASPLLGQWSWVLFFAVSFALFSFYFVIYEIAWHGQTPGKRMLHLRVQRVGGFPVEWSAALLRNLLRPIDFLFGYGVGVIVMMLTERSQRVGDLVAGTVVVRETPGGVAALERIGYDRVDGERERSVSLDTRSYELLHDFLARRPDLDPDAARRIERALAGTLRAELEREGRLTPELRALTDELFLLRVETLHRGQATPGSGSRDR
jgi:uncharacterized RDD family membrane protein YckC